MSLIRTVVVTTMTLSLSLLGSCGQNSQSPTKSSPASVPPLSNSNIASVATAAEPPLDSACALLSASVMMALVDGHSVETYHVERPVTTPEMTNNQCSFQPNQNYAPGVIGISCGQIAVGIYADWTQPSKGSLLLGSEPAPMYGVNGTHSHGFMFKASGHSGMGCLIDIAGLGNPTKGALTQALIEAYRNPRV